MVAMIDPVAIDSTFLFERSYATFLGANLIVNDEHDNTLAYGFLRSLLRLIKKLHRCRIVALLTAETYNTTDCGNINYISSILEAIGIPVHARPEEDLITVCHSILPCVRGLISENKAPLQWVCDEFLVIRPHSDYEDPFLMDGESVREDYGVDPIHIPTFLALTAGPQYARFTVQQTQRLIRTYGGLDEICRELPDNDILATRLHTFKQEILERFRCYHVTPDRPGFQETKELPTGVLAADRLSTASVLKDLGFHSLARLL